MPVPQCAARGRSHTRGAHGPTAYGGTRRDSPGCGEVPGADNGEHDDEGSLRNCSSPATGRGVADDGLGAGSVRGSTGWPGCGGMRRGVLMIVPRWEWRCFGEQFGEAEARLTAISAEQVVDSTELYLLSATGTDVVKVRDGLMDVKELQQVDDESLEQWKPVMKAPFPLSAAQVSTVLEALDIEPAAADLDGVTLGVLLDGIVEPNHDLRAVQVRKHRVRYAIGGCLAEITEVSTDKHHTRTLAVESEEPASVMAVLRDLNLAMLPNVNFGRGLKILERFGAETIAVIDVGTNSVKFHVGERDARGNWRRVVDRAEVTRLGEGLSASGRIEPEPMARTIETMAAMTDEARRRRVGAIAAVGTAGLRVAANGSEFVRAVAARCGVVVDIISGEDEARLAYRAATAGLPVSGPSVVFDTGGGSSQFSFGEGHRVEERFSVGVGAARFTEKFGLDGAVSRETVDAALAVIADDLGRLDGRPRPQTLIGMGGAITNLTSVKHGLSTYDPDVVHASVLDRAEIARQIELYRTRSADERRKIVGLQPQRAETILAGACIVATVLDKLRCDRLTVSDRSLRYGVLAERFGLPD